MLDERVVRFAIDPDYATRGVPDTIMMKSKEMSMRVVEKDRYFVMGDNRSYAIDSRFWGTVSRDDLIGPAIRVYASYDDQAKAMRWDRIGKLIN